MTLYLIASIGFFLFALTTVFNLVSVWQINSYKYSRLRLFLRQQQKHFYTPFIFPAVLLLIIGAYGFVVVDDRYTLTYQLGITIFFVILGTRALMKLKGNFFKKPRITFTAFFVTLLSITAIIAFYIFPLLDQYVWLLLITLFLPLLVAAFVSLFSFPTEIFSDMLMQRAKRKLEKLSQTKVVLLQGGADTNHLQQDILHFLLPYFQIVMNNPGQETPFSLTKIIRKQVTKETDIVLFTINALDKDSIDRLVNMLHPHIVILSGIPKAYENLPKEKKKFLLNQQYFINTLPRNSAVLLNGENGDLPNIIEKVKKIVLVYGTENNENSKQFALVAQDIHVRKDGVWFAYKMGRKKRIYRTKLHTRRALLTVLPAIFLAYVFHIPQENIETLAKMLGKNARGKAITLQRNDKK